ncbi:Deacetylase sirtuin-type domain-containing protein [Mycena indigotica]|uniref:Deacetylase sirtuin-type domain-containing protein n=1 Tax=Mycena indigotica TaxID=2126181 RepID=A0A8H6W8M4_9AGAR|nr:Deacetylase sirtuin-type domain-containing protein [Mycena indigotica]KAF7309794.1 Deacetylase sirtuin-type domain-containing protein [Mycena indigotica]
MRLKGRPSLPPELVDLIIQLLVHSHGSTASPALFSQLAPLTLVSTLFRRITLHQFFRRIVLLEIDPRKANSEWNRLLRLLLSLNDRDCYSWVRCLLVTSRALIGPFELARLSELSHLVQLSIDFATEGLATQKFAMHLVADAPPTLNILILTSLPSVNIPLLRLVASRFPYLTRLHLSTTERLDCHCWNCYEESLGCTMHSPIPSMFSDAQHLSIVFARILQPLKLLTFLHLGIFLSDETLIDEHIRHAEQPNTAAFGPEQCVICDNVAEQVRLRELTAALDFAQHLKSLRTIGFSSFFDRAIPDVNNTIVYILREGGRLRDKSLSATMAPTSTSTTTADKNAEFAKLFDLFEMLATRRSRKTPLTDADLDDTQTIPVPTELESVFRKLSNNLNIVPPRATGRARRNTVAGVAKKSQVNADSESDETDAESMAKFPLGRTHAFTFRKMIHHLYQAEEWGTKVREVLQRSKLEYKSLAEQTTTGPATKETESTINTTPHVPGRVYFKTEVKVSGKKPAPLAVQGRRRAHSIGGLSSRRSLPTSPTSPTPPARALDDKGARATKKRCIGRRKSVAGLEGHADGWFYDAAISSTERVEPLMSLSANILNRPRHQSLHGDKPTISPHPPTPVVSDDNVCISTSNAATKRRFSQF